MLQDVENVVILASESDNNLQTVLHIAERQYNTELDNIGR